MKSKKKTNAPAANASPQVRGVPTGRVRATRTITPTMAKLTINEMRNATTRLDLRPSSCVLVAAVRECNHIVPGPEPIPAVEHRASVTARFLPRRFEALPNGVTAPLECSGRGPVPVLVQAWPAAYDAGHRRSLGAMQ